VDIISNSWEKFKLNNLSWACVTDKCVKCKGKLKTNLHYEILCQTDHSCFANLGGIDVTVKLDRCNLYCTLFAS